MTKTEALDIIKQACTSVVANLQTHQTIQQAIKVIEDEIKQPEPQE